MLYIYLPVLFFYGNLYVTEGALCRRAGFSAVPAVFLVTSLVLQNAKYLAAMVLPWWQRQHPIVDGLVYGMPEFRSVAVYLMYPFIFHRDLELRK